MLQSPAIKVIGCLFILKLALNVFEMLHFLWHNASRETSSGQWGYDGFISINPYLEIILLLALIVSSAIEARAFFTTTTLLLFVAGLLFIVLSYMLPVALGRILIKNPKKQRHEHDA